MRANYYWSLIIILISISFNCSVLDANLSVGDAPGRITVGKPSSHHQYETEIRTSLGSTHCFFAGTEEAAAALTTFSRS